MLISLCWINILLPFDRFIQCHLVPTLSTPTGEIIWIFCIILLILFLILLSFLFWKRGFLGPFLVVFLSVYLPFIYRLNCMRGNCTYLYPSMYALNIKSFPIPNVFVILSSLSSCLRPYLLYLILSLLFQLCFCQLRYVY